MRAMGKLFVIGILAGVAAARATALQQEPQQPDDKRPPVISRDRIGDRDQSAPPEADKRNPAGPQQPAGGSRHGMPLDTTAVVPETRVLVRLVDGLGAGACKSQFTLQGEMMEATVAVR